MTHHSSHTPKLPLPMSMIADAAKGPLPREHVDALQAMNRGRIAYAAACVGADQALEDLQATHRNVVALGNDEPLVNPSLVGRDVIRIAVEQLRELAEGNRASAWQADETSGLPDSAAQYKSFAIAFDRSADIVEALITSKP